MMLIFFSSDGRNGFRFSQPKTTAAGIRGLRKISPQIMITAPSPTTPSAAAILGDGGGVRPDAHVDRGARIAGGCGDPADVLGHLGAANGNQLRGVATPGGLTDESVCPTLARKRLRLCGAGASACQSSLSEDLAQRFTGGGKIRQPHFDILARQHYAVGPRVECGVQGAAGVVGVGALVGGTGGGVDIDVGVGFCL